MINLDLGNLGISFREKWLPVRGPMLITSIEDAALLLEVRVEMRL